MWIKHFSVVTVRVLSQTSAYTKFHEKTWNGSLEIEEHTVESAPGTHDMKNFSVEYQEHLYKISQENIEQFSRNIGTNIRMSPKITQNNPQQRVLCSDFFVFSDHQINTKKISTKFHEKMLNHSQKREEHKKPHKNGQK